MMLEVVHRREKKLAPESGVEFTPAAPISGACVKGLTHGVSLCCIDYTSHMHARPCRDPHLTRLCLIYNRCRVQSDQETWNTSAGLSLVLQPYHVTCTAPYISITAQCTPATRVVPHTCNKHDISHTHTHTSVKTT